MTRAAERPAKTKDEIEPLEQDDLWNHPEGETPDSATNDALTLAHRAASKFPELSTRYRSFAGPAVIVSGALFALAGVAVARRVRRGQRPDEILDQITSAEIEQAATVTSRQNRLRRMITRVARRRRKASDEPNAAQ